MRLATFFVCLTMLCGLAIAQPVVISGDAGYNASSAYNRLYNTDTVITVKGKVTGIEVAPPMPNMSNAVTLIVKSTKGNTWHVDVGPEWFVNNQHAQIKIKDNVQVTGSKVSISGHEVILAEMIVKGKSVLTLRRPMGRPYWDAVMAEMPKDDGTNQRVITGVITGEDTFVDGTNGLTRRIKIHTDNGDVLVALGPDWYMQRQSVQLALGSTVDVGTWAPVGAPVTVGNGLPAPAIVFATRLGLGNQWMVLRSYNGRPYWYSIDGN